MVSGLNSPIHSLMVMSFSKTFFMLFTNYKVAVIIIHAIYGFCIGSHGEDDFKDGRYIIIPVKQACSIV